MRGRAASLDRVVPEAPGSPAIRFGRTRIGIETGEAIVGDVGCVPSSITRPTAMP